MRYFTPELYLKFNSADRGVVAKAHDEWEDAIRTYRQRLQEIGINMTTNARTVAETLCLHDADYLGMALLPVPDSGKSLAVLLIGQDATRVFLVYLLSEQPLTRQVSVEWPYSKDQVHWLYDEFDVDKSGLQQHEVLLSNGQILTLRFHEMQVVQHHIEEPELVGGGQAERDRP